MNIFSLTYILFCKRNNIASKTKSAIISLQGKYFVIIYNYKLICKESISGITFIVLWRPLDIFFNVCILLIWIRLWSCQSLTISFTNYKKLWLFAGQLYSYLPEHWLNRKCTLVFSQHKGIYIAFDVSQRHCPLGYHSVYAKQLWLT